MEKENNLKEVLIKKLNQEIENFKAELKEKGVEFAIDRAYELTSKQEIIDYIQYDIDISKNDMKAFIAKENLLDELYDEWLKSDGNMREHIGYAVDNALTLIKSDYLDSIKKNKNYDR